MVLVLYRQMPARGVAVSKPKRRPVASAFVWRWRLSSCPAWSATASSLRRWGRFSVSARRLR